MRLVHSTIDFDSPTLEPDTKHNLAELKYIFFCSARIVASVLVYLQGDYQFSVQYLGVFHPDIILLNIFYRHYCRAILNRVFVFTAYNICSHSVLIIFPLGRYSGGSK